MPLPTSPRHGIPVPERYFSSLRLRFKLTLSIRPPARCCTAAAHALPHVAVVLLQVDLSFGCRPCWLYMATPFVMMPPAGKTYLYGGVRSPSQLDTFSRFLLFYAMPAPRGALLLSCVLVCELDHTCFCSSSAGAQQSAALACGACHPQPLRALARTCLALPYCTPSRLTAACLSDYGASRRAIRASLLASTYLLPYLICACSPPHHLQSDAHVAVRQRTSGVPLITACYTAQRDAIPMLISSLMVISVVTGR